MSGKTFWYRKWSLMNFKDIPGSPKPMGVQGHLVTLVVSWAGLKVLLVLPNIFVRKKSIQMYNHILSNWDQKTRPGALWVMIMKRTCIKRVIERCPMSMGVKCFLVTHWGLDKTFISKTFFDEFLMFIWPLFHVAVKNTWLWHFATVSESAEESAKYVYLQSFDSIEEQWGLVLWMIYWHNNCLLESHRQRKFTFHS